MGLEKVTPEQRLLVTVKRLKRELDLAIAEYETEVAVDDDEPDSFELIDPETGKPYRGRYESRNRNH